jgi:putative holliday junction resolvase
MRTLAIDLGARRVGLALSDEGGRLATPYQVLQVNSPRHAIDLILPIIDEEEVEQLVVGLPLNMDDSIGKAAKDTIAWAHELASSRTGTALIFVDERLSSFAAEQNLIERKRAGEKLTRKRKKDQLDALVALQLLQEFLDGKLPELKVM